jgi:hypothetical protein
MSEIASFQEKLNVCDELIAVFTNLRLQHDQAKLRNLSLLLQGASEILTTRKRTHKSIFQKIIDTWKEIRKEQDEKNKLCGHLFNPLTSIPIGETTHSRLLGNLLNPKANHSQGSLFLEAFLKRIEVPSPEKGIWKISIETGSVEAGRVDIRLFRKSPPSVILIENKSNWAEDQPNQLYRYWHEYIHKPFQPLDYNSTEVKQSFQILYLPPAGEKSPDSNSLERPKYFDALGLPKTLDEVGVTVKKMTFRDHIAPWLDECLLILPPSNVRLSTFIQFYNELWR